MTFSIEAPLTLLQKPVEVVRFDAVVVSQRTLGLAPEVLDAVDVVSLVRQQLRVVDAEVVELAHVQRVVASQRVGVDDGVGRDLFLNKGQQGPGFCIGDDGREDSSAPP